ncbi:hypothetical protein [uncultured Christiangramia sp.]|uniref:hypothetical protein n=1 Tax=uncultured Christiangramia sp. TaxID=503836 RepID=UPI0026221DB7|nr:hypothetical protein [uncultured Christiangramia sp.]
MLDKNVAIITTVVNFELYQKTSKNFPDGIRAFVIDGRNGMHALHSILYMFKKLKNAGIDWLIMADEDVIFQDSDGVLKLIDFMQLHDYTVAGVRDGGVIRHRNNNPYSINTFFSLLNFRKILELYDANAIKKNQYIKKDEFCDDLSLTNYDYEKMSLYEPYYCFYFWLRRNGEKIYFLNSKMLKGEKDEISNQVFYPDSNPLLTHTWYARSYGKNKEHTTRINNILSSFQFKKSPGNPVIFRDRIFPLKMKILKVVKKIKLKVANN